LAPASAVAPFFYLSLIWASILGFAIWGDIPTVSLVIGSAVVVASGLFLLWRGGQYPPAKPPPNPGRPPGARACPPSFPPKRAAANACSADQFVPCTADPSVRRRSASLRDRHERDALVALHRNTIEIMRLFATYHSAHSRFTF